MALHANSETFLRPIVAFLLVCVAVASGVWLLASGFWLLASGFWLLASGLQMVTTSELPGTLSPTATV
jgi:hypothetical protein